MNTRKTVLKQEHCVTLVNTKPAHTLLNRKALYWRAVCYVREHEIFSGSIEKEIREMSFH